MNENEKNPKGQDNVLERAKRIEEKSARIAEKGKRIAQKNEYEYVFPKREDTKTDINTDQKIPDETTGAKKEDGSSQKKSPVKQRKSNGGIIVASVLSTISILLLASVAICAMLGLFPHSVPGDVSINVSGNGPIQYEGYEASPDMLEDVKHSVVVINTESTTGYGIGSGIIMTEDGYIVTNYHVVEKAKTISVSLYNSTRSVDAELVGFSESDDIAVLKIEAEGLSPVVLGDSDNLNVGDSVVNRLQSR